MRVRAPDRRVRVVVDNEGVERIAIMSVSYNTKVLTAFLLWSLHRILKPADLSILVVDNASTEGLLAMLTVAQHGGLWVRDQRGVDPTGRRDAVA